MTEDATQVDDTGDDTPSPVPTAINRTDELVRLMVIEARKSNKLLDRLVRAVEANTKAITAASKAKK